MSWYSDILVTMSYSSHPLYGFATAYSNEVTYMIPIDNNSGTITSNGNREISQPVN